MNYEESLKIQATEEERNIADNIEYVLNEKRITWRWDQGNWGMRYSDNTHWLGGYFYEKYPKLARLRYWNQTVLRKKVKWDKFIYEYMKEDDMNMNFAKRAKFEHKIYTNIKEYNFLFEEEVIIKREKYGYKPERQKLVTTTKNGSHYAFFGRPWVPGGYVKKNVIFFFFLPKKLVN